MKVLEIVHKVMDKTKEVILLVCAILSVVREFLAIAVGTGMGIHLSRTVDERNTVIVVCLMMIWMCLVLRTIHVEHTVRRSEKRFTHIDQFGHPCINVEDLPEIVEYLYRLEEMEED